MRADECLPSGHKVSDQQLSIIARPSPLGAGLGWTGLVGEAFPTKAPSLAGNEARNPGQEVSIVVCCGVFNTSPPRRGALME